MKKLHQPNADVRRGSRMERRALLKYVRVLLDDSGAEEENVLTKIETFLLTRKSRTKKPGGVGR